MSPTASSEATAQPETFEFQAETKELLDLMIHSIYSNKDIFLRELISNGSDAIDKLKFEGLTQPELAKLSQDPSILLDVDSEARTLTVGDNGIGMNRDELVNLIGTIAKSGTREFIDNMKAAQDAGEKAIAPVELIGQFGVGFYSAFMVAEKITLLTRRAGTEETLQWTSTGDGTYTLETVDSTEEFPNGTRITLQLKPADEENGLHDYTQEWTLRGIVKKYSDFVAYPIQMDVERTEIERDEDGKPKEGAQEKKVIQRDTLNSMKAIWTRPQSEVTEEEYNEFYKHIAHDWTEPAKTLWTHMEGTLEAKALLYIPSKAPFDLYHRDMARGIHLYIKRVFIMDDCKDLMPLYLRFIKGVVDSEDLSLNISREMLQQNRQIRAIRKHLVKKVLGAIQEIQEESPEDYLKLWGEFGSVLKEGLLDDEANQETLLSLSLFPSTHDPEKLTSLKDYIGRMQPDQETIYYLTGESREKIENSPHLETFREKGVEVLLLTDGVDELWTPMVQTYQEKKLASIGKGEVALGSESEREAQETVRKEKEQEYKGLLETLQNHLQEDVKEVRLSSRLTQSASCLVGGENDMTPHMEQLMRTMKQNVPKVKRVLELNPDHAVLKKLQSAYDTNPADTKIQDYANLLYGQALLAEGGQLNNPTQFTKLVSDLMANVL